MLRGEDDTLRQAVGVATGGFVGQLLELEAVGVALRPLPGVRVEGDEAALVVLLTGEDTREQRGQLQAIAAGFARRLRGAVPGVGCEVSLR